MQEKLASFPQYENHAKSTVGEAFVVTYNMLQGSFEARLQNH